MNQYNHLLNHFVYQSKTILGNNLIGVISSWFCCNGMLE